MAQSRSSNLIDVKVNVSISCALQVPFVWVEMREHTMLHMIIREEPNALFIERDIGLLFNLFGGTCATFHAGVYAAGHWKACTYMSGSCIALSFISDFNRLSS